MERSSPLGKDEAEAEKDGATRKAVLESLEPKLRQGDKALIANKGYQRYLETAGPEHFVIDPDRVAADARFDGLTVLRTNSRLPMLEVALANGCADINIETTEKRGISEAARAQGGQVGSGALC